MKRLFLLALAFTLVPVAVQAQARYGMAGCGLGSMLIKTDGFVQIFAATSNATFGIQTFGITSGTSNCTTDGVVKEDRQREAFAEASLPHILDNMANGDGEYIEALGLLYGCDQEGMERFKGAARDHLVDVCSDEQCETAAGFLTSLEAQIADDEELTATCPLIVPAA